MSEEHEDLPVPAEDERSDDELLEAAAVAEGEPSEERHGDEDLVDGAVAADAAAERDEYLEALQRVKAEFDNFKRRSAKERLELTERANAGLAERLLPVLDACDAALVHGATDVEPIHKSLVEVLEREGLERMTAEGQPFDPTRHEAVVHEPGEGEGEAIVVECLRPGYLWKGQVLRAAMVKVRG